VTYEKRPLPNPLPAPREGTTTAPCPTALWSAGLSCLVGLLVWDHQDSQAGLAVFATLVLSLGAVHGAMDVLLLVRLLRTTTQRMRATLGYLLATLAVAATTALQPGTALLVLLVLSVWHFGEHFAQPEIPSTTQRTVLRVLRGGAPVLLPALLNRPALHHLVLSLVGQDQNVAQWVWALWSALAWAWLVCAVHGGAWVCLCRNPHPEIVKKIGLEASLLAMLYLAASPLMAFGVFFGAYHCAGHIRRVLALPDNALPGLAKQTHVKTRSTLLLLASTTLITLLLGGALAWWVRTHTLSTPAWALHALIVALTSVSVPHVVLVSWWAKKHRLRPPS
jgi:Brp/Blh family beta-carotene 15,15'-monooxygenase